MEQRPIIALLYDCDKTLCTTDMQNYAFIPSLGMTPAEFWKEANTFGHENKMDGILAYMFTMIRKSEEKGVSFTRQSLVEKAMISSYSPAWRTGLPASTHMATARAWMWSTM